MGDGLPGRMLQVHRPSGGRTWIETILGILIPAWLAYLLIDLVHFDRLLRSSRAIGWSPEYLTR